MNEVKQHPTDHECNACGAEVVNEYGRKRCSNLSCITNDRDNDLSWDSDEDEISAVRCENKTYVGPAA